ncbi:predicted protein [Histoplasma capsulatum var. duboisii H88]|uniref:Predicted protein n=1 Tax=Ajellomyces capsulatus (strain H88) TaxID=544711 RepID=F0UI70_AJEC8|nr:predicted protein [Histoplasma capsulatum var. duboisii H88]
MSTSDIHNALHQESMKAVRQRHWRSLNAWRCHSLWLTQAHTATSNCGPITNATQRLSTVAFLAGALPVGLWVMVPPSSSAEQGTAAPPQRRVGNIGLLGY